MNPPEPPPPAYGLDYIIVIMLRLWDLSDLVPRMALYCNVPCEARVILEGEVLSRARA